MKDILTKVLTTATASLGGLGTYLAAKGFIALGDIGAVNGAGTSLGAALGVIAGAILTHLVMMFLAKILRAAGGETTGESRNGPSGGTVLLFLVGTAGVLGGLPSCSPEQLQAARSIPIKATVHTDQGDVSYSSKGGLEVEVDASSGK